MSFTHLQIERNPWVGGYCSQIPVLSALSSAEFVEPPPNKIPGYATDYKGHIAEVFSVTLLWISSHILFAIPRPWHNLNSSYVCAGLTLDCWVIHDWLQRNRDDLENLISLRFCVHWKFCFGRSVNHGCWALWQACDWVEKSDRNYLMSGFASKCLPATLSIFGGLGECGVY
jgi:hypothetical protein